jgi:hypothetical protein
VALCFPPHSKNAAVVEETGVIISNRQFSGIDFEILGASVCDGIAPIADSVATNGHNVCLERTL